MLDAPATARPAPPPETAAVLGVLRTAAAFDAAIADVLRPHGLTPAQYNVLRILRGAGDGGLCRSEVRDRLLVAVPDVTRLLDRLQAAGLVGRARGEADRRQVRARITADGLARLAALDGVLDALHQRQIGHLGPDRLLSLTTLLADARSGR